MTDLYATGNPFFAPGAIASMLLMLCVVLLFLLRDPLSIPPRWTRRRVRCPVHLRLATVISLDRITTGMKMRCITDCSLWTAGSWCKGSCRASTPHEPAAKPRR